MQDLIQDERFRVEIVNCYVDPNWTAWIGMHQCYSSEAAIDSRVSELHEGDEEWFGDKIIEHCLTPGHFSIAEHSCITFNVIGFPHSSLQQVLRHRNISPSVESFRYTGAYISEIGKTILEKGQSEETDRQLESVIYLRPVGKYFDRQGSLYTYDQDWFEEDLEVARKAVIKYHRDFLRGKSEEHCRGLIPFDIRQNAVMTFNMRSLMHVCAVRGMADTQIESRTLIDSLMDKFEYWTPEVGAWFRKKFYGKNRLAP
jgi:thymidylate synthase (FAD)